MDQTLRRAALAFSWRWSSPDVRPISMTTGTIGNYRWAESERVDHGARLPDVVRALADHIRGLRAVNVSWDSGRLLPGDLEIDASWEFLDGYAVSRPVDDDLIARWPYSNEGYDEWYFFRVLPTAFALIAWCNWTSAVLSEHRGMAFPSGVDLAGQLQTFAPALVIGQGTRMYVLATHEQPVQDFCALLEA